MRRVLFRSVLAFFALTMVSTAGMAQTSSTISGATSGHGRGIGLGAVQMLNSGWTDLLVTYGASGGKFHLDGLFGLAQNINNGGGGDDNSVFNIGGRFWYHLHAASMADFSVGAGLLLNSHRDGANQDRQMDILLDLGVQMRVFLVSNVALLGSFGMGITIPDGGDSRFWIGGKPLGSIGMAYFFE